MKHIKHYIAPLIICTLLLTGLFTWRQRQLERNRQHTLDQLSATGKAINGALNGSIQSESRRSGLKVQRLKKVFEDIIAETSLEMVELRDNNKVLVSAGETKLAEKCNNSKQTSTGFEELCDDTFLYGRSINLNKYNCSTAVGRNSGSGNGHGGNGKGQGGQGQGRNRTQTDELVIKHQEQLLILGFDASLYTSHTTEAREKLQSITTLGCIAILLLFIFLSRFSHHRSMGRELQKVRLRADKLEELSLAAGGLAHEIKNPLGIIRGIAQRGMKKGQECEMFEMVLDNTEVAVSRLGDFISYARMPMPELRLIRADQLTERIVNLMKYDFESKDIEFTCNVPALDILADPEMTEQVLVNLLRNSLNATCEAGVVKVELQHHGETSRLTVSDSGKGISAGQVTEIFKPYVSGNSDGHGLGLAIVRRIVEDSGWTIDVKSEPDKGTEMIISGIRNQ